jgi:hypothetical protein
VTLIVAWSPAALAQEDPGRRTESGSLESGDLRLSSGEYHDDFMVEGKAGSLVILDLHSLDFDAFVQMSPRNTTGPNGNKEWHNNDAYKFGTDAGMAVTLPENGQYDVYVTSATAAETGSYTLGITVLDAPGQSEAGKLSDDDRKLDTGEYCDYYDFEAKQGELWVIEVTSYDFNTYLFGRSTDDREYRIVNDDTFGEEKHSQVLMNIPRDGKYFVGVTSAQTGETGEYRVTLSSTRAVGPPVRPPVHRGITEGAKGLGVQSPSNGAQSPKAAPAPE